MSCISVRVTTGSLTTHLQHNSLWESEVFPSTVCSSSSESLALQETIFPSYVDWILSSNKTTIKVPCSAPETRLNKKCCSPHPKPWDHHRQTPHKSPSIPPKFPAQTSICKAHRSNSPKTQLGPRQMDLRSWVVFFLAPCNWHFGLVAFSDWDREHLIISV